jgi:glycosyltransferase involved in cell wall biosynthesis
MNLFPLGAGSRTGIFRVADEVARGLAQRMGAGIGFHALGANFGSKVYFDGHLAASGARWMSSWVATLLLPVFGALESRVGDTRGKGLHLKVLNRLARVLLRPLERLVRTLPSAALEDFNVYHSPFARIPEQIRARGGLVCFTTIYDLIPLSHPEFFTPGTIQTVRAIIDGLGPDDYALCISAATRSALLEHSQCRPERALVIPLAASGNFFPAREAAGNAAVLARYGIRRAGYVLSLCTFEIRKNLETLIAAYVAARQSGGIRAEIQLVLVGGRGWKSERVEEALAGAGEFRADIILPGFVADEDLAVIYSSARVFAYMSVMEGFGLPPLEAMQCGTPVVTSNCSALPEVVGDAGVMLDPHDVAGLAEVLARLFNEDDFHRELAEKSLERAKVFSWQRHIDETLSAYESALRQG